LCTQATCTDNEIEQCCSPFCKRNCKLNDQFIPHKGQIVRRSGSTCIHCKCHGGRLNCKKMKSECPQSNCLANERIVKNDCCNECSEPPDCRLCDQESTNCIFYGRSNVTCECKTGFKKLNEFSCF